MIVCCHTRPTVHAAVHLHAVRVGEAMDMACGNAVALAFSNADSMPTRTGGATDARRAPAKQKRNVLCVR